MNGKTTREYLQEICHALDAGRPLSKTTLRKILAPVAVPAALTLALGMPACIEDTAVDYGAPFEMACDDGADNDGDGLTDCFDDDCFDDSACMPEFEDDCTDEVDNDDDGLVDCLDREDCSDDPACVGNLYGAPWA